MSTATSIQHRQPGDDNDDAVWQTLTENRIIRDEFGPACPICGFTGRAHFHSLPPADPDIITLTRHLAVALAALRQIADMQDDPADMRLVARRAIAAVTRG